MSGNIYVQLVGDRSDGQQIQYAWGQHPRANLEGSKY